MSTQAKRRKGHVVFSVGPYIGYGTHARRTRLFVTQSKKQNNGAVITARPLQEVSRFTWWMSSTLDERLVTVLSGPKGKAIILKVRKQVRVWSEQNFFWPSTICEVHENESISTAMCLAAAIFSKPIGSWKCECKCFPVWLFQIFCTRVPTYLKGMRIYLYVHNHQFPVPSSTLLLF